MANLLPFIFSLLTIWVAVTTADDYDSLKGTNGNDVIVFLFEWKWTDIANECETFLAPAGYAAVRTSPPNEHLYRTFNGKMPWWVDYQPVSYILESRRGNRAQFTDMVNRCNNVGVRVISDVVVNHMVGVGQKKGQPDVGSWGPSDFDGKDGIELFPGVPYGPNDFNDKYCHGDIQPSDYKNNADRVRRCRLVGLLDLNHHTDYVRGRIVGYFNDLLSIGVSGLRIDAAKHMYPGDIAVILDNTTNLNSAIFGPNVRPYAVGEVIDMGGEAVHAEDYVGHGRVANFRCGPQISAAVKRTNNFKYFKSFGFPPWFPWQGHDVEVFIDDHDTQRSNGETVTYKDGAEYTMANGFMLAYDYGVPRVMSSYYFSTGDADHSPPVDGRQRPTSPTFNGDKTCPSSSGWVCEHRWPAIRRMVAFRNTAGTSAVGNVVTDEHRLAFAREGRAYFAVNNNADQYWNVQVTTGLPAGNYCEVYSGELINGRCTGKTITVDGSGKANINVPNGQFIAIHTAQVISIRSI